MSPIAVAGDAAYFAGSIAARDSKKAAALHGLERDYWTLRVQGDLWRKIDELHAKPTEYVVLARPLRCERFVSDRPAATSASCLLG